MRAEIIRKKMQKTVLKQGVQINAQLLEGYDTVVHRRCIEQAGTYRRLDISTGSRTARVVQQNE